MIRLEVVVASSLLVVAACSSSSSGTGPGADAGDASNVLSPLADSGGSGLINASCGQLATFGGGTASACASGQTCCTTFSATTFSVSASCVAQGQCGGISNECQTEADCSGGQVCCAGVAATDAGAADAAAEGGAGGLLGGFNPATLSTSCQATCAPGQMQQCASSSVCPPGETCRANAAGGAGAFGGAGDAGGLAGFGGLGGPGGAAGVDGGDGGGFASPRVCGAPLPEAGTTGIEAGSPPDAGQAGDAAAAGDAPTE